MLSKTLLFTASALLSLTSALPTTSKPNIVARAGGPEAVPIPSTCTVTSPMPTTESEQTFYPGPSTDDAAGYYAYYPAPTTNQTALWTECIEQCYGYAGAGSGQCVSAYLANNAPTPAGYYGTPGGNLETACLFFNRTLTTADFVAAPSGQYTGAQSGNIEC